MPLRIAFAAWFALREAERRDADGEEIERLKEARAKAEEGVHAWLVACRATLGTARSEHPGPIKRDQGPKVAGWVGREKVVVEVGVQVGLFGGGK